MSWQATLTITNNTDYNIDVVHNLPEGLLTTLSPESSEWSWSTVDVNNTIALKFWQQPNNFFMQGSVSYGPSAGVYVDRGWMDPNAQTIQLIASANQKTWLQTSNGGKTLLAWNEFTDGGNISLTFNKT